MWDWFYIICLWCLTCVDMIFWFCLTNPHSQLLILFNDLGFRVVFLLYFDRFVFLPDWTNKPNHQTIRPTSNVSFKSQANEPTIQQNTGEQTNYITNVAWRSARGAFQLKMNLFSRLYPEPRTPLYRKVQKLLSRECQERLLRKSTPLKIFYTITRPGCMA